MFGHHNRVTLCPKGYQGTSCVEGDHWRSSEMALTGYLVFHAQLGEFLLNQSNQVKVVGCASQPYGFEGEWTPPLKLVQSSVWQFNHISVSGLEYG